MFYLPKQFENGTRKISCMIKPPEVEKKKNWSYIYYMNDFHIYGNNIDTVFDLLGKNENRLTFAISYSLSRCPTFLNKFLKFIIPSEIQYKLDQVEILCQNNVENGFTDIELSQKKLFRLIFEAKVGCQIPTEDQIRKYARSLNSVDWRYKNILTLSDSLSEEAKIRLGDMIYGIPIRHMQFQEVIVIAKTAALSCKNSEKGILRELVAYLKGGTNMIDPHSNIVYVVPLGSAQTIEEHNEKRQYHCPVGNGYIKTPPNYIAFRFHGKLQFINHVESYVNYYDGEKLYFRFFLGPDIVPSKEIKLGQQDGRGFKVYCDIDLLLTCNTIKEASEATKRRHP